MTGHAPAAEVKSCDLCRNFSRIILRLNTVNNIVISTFSKDLSSEYGCCHRNRLSLLFASKYKDFLTHQIGEISITTARVGKRCVQSISLRRRCAEQHSLLVLMVLFCFVNDTLFFEKCFVLSLNLFRFYNSRPFIVPDRRCKLRVFMLEQTEICDGALEEGCSCYKISTQIRTVLYVYCQTY